MRLLSNQHILLRALEPEDLNFLKAIENDPDNWKHGDTIQPFSEYILKEYIKVAEQSITEAGQLRLMIADLQDEKRIGFIDLYDFDQRNARAGVAIIIHPDFQRNKFALQALQIIEKYAFDKLHLHQLYASILADNLPSIKLFEKAGYTYSGNKKAWRKTDNEFKDELFYQKILNEEQK